MTRIERVREFLRFAVGGALGVASYYATFIILTKVVGVWYITSAIVGGVVNFVVNFTMHKLFTFKNRNADKIRKQFNQYLVVFTGVGVTNVVMLYVFVEWMRLDVLVAQVVLTVLMSGIGYVATRWAFKD